MISDTGARLAEIIGASVQDLDIDSSKAPTLHIRPHNWRSLKTLSSNRTIPLVGAALWGARCAASSTQDAFLFVWIPKPWMRYLAARPMRQASKPRANLAQSTTVRPGTLDIALVL